MKNDFDRVIQKPKTVAATQVLLSALMDKNSPFDVLENFHPAFEDSLTLVHAESGSAITIVIVEASDGDD